MQFDQLKRREFMTLLASAAAWPLAARAQQRAKILLIGPREGFMRARPVVTSIGLAAPLARLAQCRVA